MHEPARPDSASATPVVRPRRHNLISRVLIAVVGISAIAVGGAALATFSDPAADVLEDADARTRLDQVRAIRSVAIAGSMSELANRDAAEADLIVVDPKAVLQGTVPEAEARLARLQHTSKGRARIVLADVAVAAADSRGIERVMALGFDGVMLRRPAVLSAVPAEAPDLDAALIEHVLDVARDARTRNPGFIVMLGDGEEMLRYPRLIPMIDGVVKSDLSYRGGSPAERNSKAEIAASTLYLKTALTGHRPVFVIEHLLPGPERDRASRLAERAGFKISFGLPKVREQG